MKKKVLTRSDQATLLLLLERYSKDVVRNAIDECLSARQKAGAPAKNVGNLAAVYGYVDVNRAAPMAGGRTRGVDAACAKLKQLLDKMTVDCKITKGRIRSMYYEAQKRSETDVQLAHLMSQARLNFQKDYEINGENSLAFPLLLVRAKDGSLQGPVIDTLGLGGKAVPQESPKSLH